jgi:hypothetical protein
LCKSTRQWFEVTLNLKYDLHNIHETTNSITIWVYLLLGDQGVERELPAVSEDEGFLFSTSRKESLGKEDFLISCKENKSKILISI